jgi:hypothetical protein
MKSAGARSAGNPHAACDVAGAGNGITEASNRARRWKRRTQPRNFLRIYAPALDPTTGLDPIQALEMLFAFADIGLAGLLEKTVKDLSVSFDVGMDGQQQAGAFFSAEFDVHWRIIDQRSPCKLPPEPFRASDPGLVFASGQSSSVVFSKAPCAEETITKRRIPRKRRCQKSQQAAAPTDRTGASERRHQLDDCF